MTQPLLNRVGSSKLSALEEIIFATYAVKIQANPIVNPGSHALLLRRHSMQELKGYLQDENVFFVHKIGMNQSDVDRIYLKSLIGNKGSDIYTEIKENYSVIIQTTRMRQILSRCKDFYLKLFA